MDLDGSGGEISSASSVDFQDPADWIIVKAYEAGSGSKTTTLTYRTRRFIAEGTFGRISRILTSDRKTFALKKVDSRTRIAMQEVNIMLQLQHPNLVKINYYYKKHFDKTHMRVFIIMEFVPQSLVDHIVSRHEMAQKFPHHEIALILYQILRGLEHMHRRNIAHRDIKPQNILIDVDEQIVKICDFGSAKNLSTTNAGNSTYVCSRWYRAPELLQQNVEYTTKVDVWSCGCVLAELILHYPLFRGADSVDQWACIKDILGSPTPEECKDIGIRSSVNNRFIRRKNLKLIFKGEAPQDIISLFEELVRYSHSSRPTAWRALAHAAFDVLGTHEIRSTYPHLFNFTTEELSYEPDILQLFQADVHSKADPRLNIITKNLPGGILASRPED